MAGESLPVRSAPFDNAPQTGAVPANARVFICDHSLDEKWFGIVYDKSGQLVTASFMDYPMPRAGFLHDVQLLDFPVPTPTNPLGVKGVGESGVTGSLPTMMNAITDALALAGVKAFDMPATPARVWAAIQAARAGQPEALAITAGA